ncbi:RAP domain-containing protein [Cardiosporidium cionae]|uniref:RAP domain-containing protein n=1 Tax=Cardiosporidium cionae TaxID=476202 RepID=A0ABQ7JDC5_9APIC|nr:RAP domain-containing protein [Cardiosporidium cionae]|eukprot:KAF8822027.1 RAP domain-containing protein [Cardiosporidium cionae]
MAGVLFSRVQQKFLLVSFSSCPRQSSQVALRFFYSPTAVTLRRFSSSQCLCSASPNNFTFPSCQIEKPVWKAIQCNFTAGSILLSHFTRNGNDCSKRFFSSTKPLQGTAEMENLPEQNTPNEKLGEVNEKLGYETRSEHPPAHSACSSLSLASGYPQEVLLPAEDVPIQPVITVEAKSHFPCTLELDAVAIGEDVSLDSAIVSEGKELLHGRENTDPVTSQHLHNANSPGDTLKDENKTLSHSESFANNCLSVLPTHNMSQGKPQTKRLRTEKAAVAPGGTKENNVPPSNEKVAPIEGRPLVFDGDIEVLSPEQQKQKEELIKELTRRLSGPLANENGKVPSGKDRPTAIEVDGPSHFYANSNRYTAYTKLKHRLLTRMGYRVLHVPYFDWRKLRSPTDREEYMRTKLLEEPTEWLDPEDEIFYKNRLEALENQQRTDDKMVSSDSTIEKANCTIDEKQDEKDLHNLKIEDKATTRSTESLPFSSPSETENAKDIRRIFSEKSRAQKEGISAIKNHASTKRRQPDMPLTTAEDSSYQSTHVSTSTNDGDYRSHAQPIYSRKDFTEVTSRDTALHQGGTLQEPSFQKEDLQHERHWLSQPSSTASTKRIRKQTLNFQGTDPYSEHPSLSGPSSMERYPSSTTKGFTSGYVSPEASSSSRYAPVSSHNAPFQNQDSAHYQYNSSESSPLFKQSSQMHYNIENKADPSYTPRRQEFYHSEETPSSGRSSPPMAHPIPSRPSPPQGHRTSSTYDPPPLYTSPQGRQPPSTPYGPSSQYPPVSYAPPSQQHARPPPRSVPYGQQYPLPHSPYTHQGNYVPSSDSHSLPTYAYGQQSYQSPIPPYNQQNLPPPQYDPRFQNYGIPPAYTPSYDPRTPPPSYPGYSPPPSSHVASPYSLPGAYPPSYTSSSPNSHTSGYSSNWQQTGAPITEPRNPYPNAPESRYEERSPPHLKNRIPAKPRLSSSGAPPSGRNPDYFAGAHQNPSTHYEAPFTYGHGDFPSSPYTFSNEIALQRQRPSTLTPATDEQPLFTKPQKRIKQPRRMRSEDSATGYYHDSNLAEYALPVSENAWDSSEALSDTAQLFENAPQNHLKGKKRQ